MTDTLKIDLSGLKTQAKLDAMKAKLAEYEVGDRTALLDEPLKLEEYAKLKTAIEWAEPRIPYAGLSDEEMAKKIHDQERVIEDARLEYKKLVEERGEEALRSQDALEVLEAAMTELHYYNVESHNREAERIADGLIAEQAKEAAEERRQAEDAKALEEYAATEGVEPWQVDIMRTTLEKTPLESRKEGQKWVEEAAIEARASLEDRLLSRANANLSLDETFKLSDAKEAALAAAQEEASTPDLPVSAGEGEGDAGGE